jgi:hypothetical protein
MEYTMDFILSLVMVVLALVVLAVLWLLLKSIVKIVINSIVGLLVLFIANLFFVPPIPINFINVIICALGGIIGAFLLIILRLFGITL